VGATSEIPERLQGRRAETRESSGVKPLPKPLSNRFGFDDTTVCHDSFASREGE
jgi:hypothetical protein